MRVIIESIQPDGLSVKFDQGFIFDTWAEALEFIVTVDELERKMNKRANERAKKAVKEMMKRNPL